MAVGVLHIVLGLVTVAITYWLAQRWGVGVPSLTGLFVAIDPLLLYQSTLVMTETLAALLTVVTLSGLTLFCQRRTAASALFVRRDGRSINALQTYVLILASGAHVGILKIARYDA